MTDYTTELSKPEYASLSNAERLALIKSKTVSTIGRIEESKLKGLESIIAENLWRDKMESMKAAAKDTLSDPLSSEAEKALANNKLMIVAGFHEAIAESKLANKAPYVAGGHSINLGDAKVNATFQAAKAVGLLSDAEVSSVLALASYDKPLFPDVTMFDVVSHFNPELIDGTWRELGELNAQWLTFKLRTATPEQTYIKIESRDIDGDWRGDWTHNTARNGVQAARIYKVAIRNEGRQELRWRCEYALDVEVS